MNDYGQITEYFTYGREYKENIDLDQEFDNVIFRDEHEEKFPL